MGICVSSRKKNKVSTVEPPHLILPPKGMFCRGATVNIRCAGIPPTSQDIKWLKNNIPIPTNSSEKAVLCLKNLMQGHDGTYRCEITESSGTQISSNEVEIAIKDKAANKLSVQKNLLFEGAQLEIECESNIPEVTEVCWYKDDTEILMKGRFSNGTNGNLSLTISNLQISDSGNYKCKTINTFGFAEDAIYLEVKEIESPSVDDIVNLVANGKVSIFSVSAIASNLPQIVGGITMFLSSQRICVLSIANKSGRKLSNPKVHVQDGRQTHSVESIDNGKAGLFVFTTEGTFWHIRTDGVLTFDVEGTRQQIAILWSVPYTNFYSNQFAIKIRPQGSKSASKSLYEELLRNAPTTGYTVEEKGDGYTITATMSKHSKAHLCLNLEITG